MATYSAYFSWPGGDDTATYTALSDETAIALAFEHARMPWRGWPARNCGIPVDIDLAVVVEGGFRSLGTFEVDR